VRGIGPIGAWRRLAAVGPARCCAIERGTIGGSFAIDDASFAAQ